LKFQQDLCVRKLESLGCRSLCDGKFRSDDMCGLGKYPAWLKDTIAGVHVSPVIAETLVRRGGITVNKSPFDNTSLTNVSAKNYQNRLMRVEVTVCCNISVVFRHCRSVIGFLTQHGMTHRQTDRIVVGLW